MVLLKTTAVFLLAVACVSAISPTVIKLSQDDHAEHNVDLSVEPIKPLLSGTNTTLISSTTSNPSTSINSTTKTPETTTKIPTTTPALPTTTLKPNVTTTQSPNVTTTTLSPNVTTTTHNPNVTTTTQSPNVTTTTLSPNVTTALPPTPEPSPARSWDGPSFLGGMVLAFGIVAVGFVGYRFFYLGRGGAYHTL